MKFVKKLSVVALVLFVASIARADGFDGHVLLGGGPGGSPSCNSFQGSTNAQGLINGECVVTGQTATSFQFAIQDQNSNGGLGCASSLTEVGWTVQLSNHPGGIDVCTVTAPTSGGDSPKHLRGFNGPENEPPDPPNPSDCELEDFGQGIPVGCDITFSTDDPNKLFKPNALFDVSANNSPLANLPEPGSLSLLLSGLTGLVFLRRKFAR